MGRGETTRSCVSGTRDLTQGHGSPGETGKFGKEINNAYVN